MTADERIEKTKNAIELAVKELSEIFVNKVHGYGGLHPEYRAKLASNLMDLIRIRENFT